MPTTATMLAFALVSAGLIVFPGPSTVFLLTHGAAHGRRAALAATVGMETASATRIILTAAGLSAVLASSAIAFGIVRWAGVAYLGFLGVRALVRRHAEASSTAPAPATSMFRSGRKGLIVGLGNPKMVMFFLAFFPQFVHPQDGSRLGQMLVLGVIFWLLGSIWDLMLAAGAGVVGGWLARHRRVRAAQPTVEGLTYLGLAGWSALSSGSER